MNQTRTQTRLRYRNYLKQIKGYYQKPIAKTSSALIFTLITITFFGLAAIKPTLSTVSQLLKEIESKREIETKLTQKLAALSSVQDEYLSSKDRFDVLDTAIPPTQNLNLLLLQIEYLSWLNQVQIDSLHVNSLIVFSQTPVSHDTTDVFPSYSISYSALAPTQGQLRALLEDINTLDRIIRIESVTFFESPDEDSDLIQLNANFRAYWSPTQPTQQ